MRSPGLPDARRPSSLHLPVGMADFAWTVRRKWNVTAAQALIRAGILSIEHETSGA